MHHIKYKHWKKEDVIYDIIGEIVHCKPNSDRIVVKLESGEFEDIIKDTIILKEEI
jgi:hypothetical protein